MITQSNFKNAEYDIGDKCAGRSIVMPPLNLSAGKILATFEVCIRNTQGLGAEFAQACYQLCIVTYDKPQRKIFWYIFL